MQILWTYLHRNNAKMNYSSIFFLGKTSKVNKEYDSKNCLMILLYTLEVLNQNQIDKMKTMAISQ